MVKAQCLEMETVKFEDNNIALIAGGNNMEFNMWYLFNGPLADLSHHVGQVSYLRRLAGNPIASGVEPFFGKRLEG